MAVTHRLDTDKGAPRRWTELVEARKHYESKEHRFVLSSKAVGWVSCKGYVLVAPEMHANLPSLRRTEGIVVFAGGSINAPKLETVTKRICIQHPNGSWTYIPGDEIDLAGLK